MSGKGIRLKNGTQKDKRYLVILERDGFQGQELLSSNLCSDLDFAKSLINLAASTSPSTREMIILTISQ